MSTITRAQRVAMKRVFDRTPLYNLPINADGDLAKFVHRRYEQEMDAPFRVITYKEFRLRSFNTRNGLMVPWCGMWLGIETDGHVHS